MKKRSLVLIVLTLCLLCAAALADDGFTLSSNSIQSIPEGLTDVVIPAEVDGEPVLALSGYALANNEAITSITLPEGLCALDNAGVYANESLTSLTLPSTLQVISTYNVYSCGALEEVTIPAAVQYIGGFSFCFNDNLRSVTFLGQPPMIHEDAFWDLEEDCVVYVPDDCLWDYMLALPEGLTVMPSGRNAEVVDRTLPAADLDFDPATGTITGYHGTAFAGELPAAIDGVAVTAIGADAFAGLDGTLRFLRLPEGLTAIGSGAFSHAKLIGITLPSTLKTIGDSAFMWAVDLVPVWPKVNGIETIGAHAFEATDLPGIFHIPYGVREIGDSAFYNNNFAELYFPETIQSVGSQAFARSAYIAYMAFAGADLPQFGEGTFDCQENLTDVDIAWDASRAQYETACAAFADMGMTACTVWRNNPSSAGVAAHAESGYVDGLLMSYDQELDSVTVYTSFDNVNTTGVGESCFENCQTIQRFYPHHCGWFTTIGARAFQNSSLQYIELFDSITEIGEDAFCGTKLTSVTIPASVTFIGGGAFAWCSELTDVTVLCDPELLPDDAFSCSDQVTLHVSDEVSPKACKALSDRLEVNVVRPSGIPEDVVCPYPATNAADFWIDETFNRLDHYMGYELNLVLPQDRDGVALTMLSGNTLTRARSEDGSPVELPVRSVVVPEKYEEVVYNAFNDLPDLEVAVIYAPLPMAFNSMFSNCPNLRAVVFVNGVGTVTGYAFNNCPALETVYLGPDAQVDAAAFVNCGAMMPETVSAVLPDVDALLAAVKSDPIAAPEAAPEPEMPDAEPITDPNAAVYLGAWNLLSLTMEDMTFSPADFGLTMTMVLTDDGRAAMLQGEDSDYTVWRMEDGVAYILADGESFSPILLNEDGTFTLAQDGTSMTFGRGDAAVTAVALPAEAMSFVGSWVTEDGSTRMDIIDNGTVVMYAGDESQQTTWGYDSGAAYLVLGPGASVPMVLTEAALEIRADNMTLVLVRSDAAEPVSDPGTAPEPAPADSNPFAGNWTCIWLLTGMGGCDPVSTYGGNWDFVINADGTGVLYAGGPIEAALEVDEYGFTRFNDMSIVIRDDGRLQYGSERSGGMIFSLVPGDKWDPAVDAFVNPGEVVIEQVSQQGAELTQQTLGTASEAPAALSDRIGMKFVATSATTGGFSMDASMLGGEYAITFAANNDALFVMVGMEVPGLKWTADDAAFHVTYFDGTDLVFVATPEGFDLDYYGAMVLHFVPAE